MSFSLQSTEYLRALIDCSGDDVFVHDATTRFVDVNDTACKNLLYTREELLGMHAWEISVGHTPDWVREQVAKLEPGRAILGIAEHRRKDGTVFPSEVRVTAFVYDGRKLYVCVAREISERMRAERVAQRLQADLERLVEERTKELHDAKALLERVLESTTEAIFVKDLHGRYLMCNRAAAQFIERPVDEIIGRDDSAIFSADYARTLMENDQKVIAGGPTAHAAEETAQIGQDQLVFLVNKSVFLDEAGKPAGVVGIARDVTALKRAEAAQRENETRLKYALDAADEGVFDWNILSDQVLRSPRWKTMLGYHEEELDDHLTWSRLLHPDDRARVDAEQARHFAGETARYVCEYRMRAKDGGWRWILARGRLVERTASGAPLRFIGTHLDITERKENEEKIRKLSERVELAVSTGKIGIYEVNLLTGAFLYNQQLREIFEFEPTGEHAAQPAGTYAGTARMWRERILPEDLADLDRRFADLLDPNNRVVQANFRIRVPSGAVRYLSSYTQVVSRGEDRLVTIGTVLDVTRHDALTRALSAEKERLELARRVSGIGIWETERATQVTRCDARLCDIYGVPTGALDDDPTLWLQCLHPEDRDRVLAARRDASARNATYDAEYRIVHRASGAIRHVRSVADFSMNAQSTVGIEWDISKERQASVLLLHAKDAAVAGERAKSEFIASISHELRTPMNSIMVMTELLLEESLAEKHHEMISVMRRSGADLLLLINDILDYSKIEAGKMRLRDEPFDLHATLELALQSLQLSASRKNLALRLAFEVRSDVVLLGDADRLRQIVTNLVNNAIKFTDHGEVAVTARVRHSDAEKIALRIEVSDTGVGIPLGVQAQLFQPFKQADQSDRRRYGGSGLGLVISREIARAMGGDIGFRSEEDRGSAFWLDLELPRATKTPPSPRAASPTPDGGPAYRPLSLLFVEDNEANQRVGTLLFEKLGHVVTLASDGAEALQWLRDQRFDCVLMDCQMPELDGYDTTRLIRSGTQRVLDPRVPVIALTAAGMPGDRERCLAAGMNDYALKPLNRRALAAAFFRCGLTLLGSSEHTVSIQESSAMLDPEHIEELRGLRLADGETLLHSIAVLILNEIPASFHVLREQAQRRGAVHALAVAKLAHEMAGSCASIGALDARDHLRAVEVAAAANEDNLSDVVAHAELAWRAVEPHIVALLEPTSLHQTA